jgi:hypothetical protein
MGKQSILVSVPLATNISWPAWKVFAISFPISVQHPASGLVPEVLQVSLRYEVIL